MTGVILATISSVRVCFMAYLVFCLLLVRRTGDSRSLVHAGKAVREFGAALIEPIFSALAKIMARVSRTPLGSHEEDRRTRLSPGNTGGLPQSD